MTHPLTEKLLTQFGIPDDRCVEGERVFFDDDMRAAADWQLEQVIEWLKSQEDYPGTLYYELPTLDCESIECSLRHAMRPTQTTNKK